MGAGARITFLHCSVLLAIVINSVPFKDNKNYSTVTWLCWWGFYRFRAHHKHLQGSYFIWIDWSPKLKGLVSVIPYAFCHHLTAGYTKHLWYDGEMNEKSSCTLLYVNSNNIILSLCHMPVNFKSLIDRCGSPGSTCLPRWSRLTDARFVGSPNFLLQSSLL